MAPPRDICSWALPAGGTLGFGLVGNDLGAVLEGRTLGHEKGSPTSASVSLTEWKSGLLCCSVRLQ